MRAVAGSLQACVGTVLPDLEEPLVPVVATPVRCVVDVAVPAVPRLLRERAERLVRSAGLFRLLFGKCVAMMPFGGISFSTHCWIGASVSNTFGPGPPEQW